MKIAVIAGVHRYWNKYRWVADALEVNGHEVRRVCGDRHESAAAEQWADIAIWEPKYLQNFSMESGGLSRDDGHDCLRVGWMFDLVAQEPGKPLAEQGMLWRHDGQNLIATPLLTALRACDLAFVKERGLIDQYRRIGVNAEWLDQACPSSMGACEHRENPKWDALVLGTTRWKQRCRDVAALVAAGLKVAWAAPEGSEGVVKGVEYLPFTPPEQLPELVSDAAVLFDCGLRSDLDGYWSDKFWLALGMGACHVRRWSPGLPEPFAISTQYVAYWTYKTPTEAVAQVRKVAADQRRKLFGDGARRWMLANHTYEERCKKLVRRCEVMIESAAGAAAPAT